MSSNHDNMHAHIITSQDEIVALTQPQLEPFLTWGISKNRGAQNRPDIL